MRAKHIVQLNDEQRVELEQLTRTGIAAARVLNRARILLLADRCHGTGKSDDEIVDALSISHPTVQRIRRLFCTEGLHRALYHRKSPGPPLRITGEAEARLTMLACSTPPEGRARWTLQLLADHMVTLGYVESISDTKVHDILKKRTQTLAEETMVYPRQRTEPPLRSQEVRRCGKRHGSALAFSSWKYLRGLVGGLALGDC